MSKLQDKKADKDLYNRIQYTAQQFGQLVSHAKMENNLPSILKQAQSLYNYAVSLYKQMSNAVYSSTNYRANAKRLIDSMQSQLQQISSASSTDEDGRTSDLGSTTLGDIENIVQNVLNGQPNLNDPQQAALFDLLAQLAMTKQQYTWQQNADDLAYQRTNFSTLLNQYMSAGMSRAAALQAASSTLPTTAGSSVGAGISPDMLGAAAQNQNAGIAQQNAATQRDSVQLTHMDNLQALHNEQVRIANERWAMEQQYWTQSQMKKAYEDIQKAYELTYALHGNHVDVPMWATQSHETYKDWLRDGSDFIAKLAELVNDGTLVIDDDGNYCATYVSSDGTTKLTDPVVTAKQVHDSSLMKQIYDEYQKHVGDVFYEMMVQQQFMNQAGPRAYHQQEDYSTLMMNKIRVEGAELALREVTNAIESDEINAAVMQKFRLWYQQEATDDQRQRVHGVLDANHLHLNTYGQVCRWGDQVEEVTNRGDADDVSTWEVPLSAYEMSQLGLVSLGANMDAYYNALSVLQGAKLATDNEHFKSTFALLHEKDAVALSQLHLNRISNESALCLFDDHKWLQRIAGAGIVWRACGFDRVAATAAGIAVGAFKATSLVQAAKHAKAHHITESYDAEGNLSVSEEFNVFK